MSKPKTREQHNKEVTLDQMVEFGIGRILQAFGKGEDLKGAVTSIVIASAQWGRDNTN